MDTDSCRNEKGGQMKIITYVESEWDDSLGRYVTVPGSEESYEYSGPIAHCGEIIGDIFGGGSSSSTTTMNVPEKTQTEKDVDELTLKQLRRQDEQAARMQPIIQQYLDDYKAERDARQKAGLTPEERALAERESIDRAKRMSDLEEQLANINLESVKRGGKASPEQIEAINAATGAAQKTGEADIERFRTATLRQINEEIAAASGLRPTDTPIVRLSERAGEEATRQQGMLTSRLAETNATARLNFPLATQKLTADIASTQEGLSQAAAQFQQQLQIRAQDNRFRLFAGGSTPTASATGFGATLANERFAGASRTTNSEKSLGLAELGQAAGGIGGLMQGASLFFGSDRRLKKHIKRIGVHRCGAPLYEFEYVWGGGKHIGVMADEILPINPGAVASVGGYLMVNYAAI